MSRQRIQKDFNALAGLCVAQGEAYKESVKEFKKANVSFWIVAAVPTLSLLALGVCWYFFT